MYQLLSRHAFDPVSRIPPVVGGGWPAQHDRPGLMLLFLQRPRAVPLPSQSQPTTRSPFMPITPYGAAGRFGLFSLLSHVPSFLHTYFVRVGDSHGPCLVREYKYRVQYSIDLEQAATLPPQWRGWRSKTIRPRTRRRRCLHQSNHA